MDLFKILGTVAVETNGAEEELDDITRKARNTGDGFENVDSKAKRLANSGFTVLKGAASNLISSGFSKLLSAMGELISSGVDYSRQIEQYQTSFETMTGSADKAAEVTAKLQEIGAATPFELTNLADTTQLLMNYGFTADDAIGKMTMLGDISQGSSEKMTRIATAYGQMSSAGKVSLEDVKQMIEAGFNPLMEISESTGESMESLYDRISKGTISVDEITASMERSTAEGGKYFGSMDAQSQTLNGRLSTLKDTANESIGNIIGGLLQKAAVEWIPKLTVAVSQVDEKFHSFVGKIKELPEKFAPAIQVVSDTWNAIGKPVFEIIQTYVNTIADTFGQKMPAIKEFVSNAFSDIKAFWENNLLPCFEAIGNFIEGYLAPIFDAVFTVAIGGVVNNVFNTIKSLWENTLKPVFTGITDFLTGVFTGNWGQAFRGILDIATGIWNGIKTSINSVMESIKTIVATGITFLREAFNFDWSLPKIKLPHFKIDGTFSLNPPSVPSFGIDWYAKGGVLEEPTIFGMNGNRLMGGGEAGAEAVAPIDVLQGYVAEAVANQNAGMVAVLERILDAILSMDANMGGNLREALDGTSLSINHREFGRLVKAVN